MRRKVHEVIESLEEHLKILEVGIDFIENFKDFKVVMWTQGSHATKDDKRSAKLRECFPNISKSHYRHGCCNFEENLHDGSLEHYTCTLNEILEDQMPNEEVWEYLKL